MLRAGRRWAAHALGALALALACHAMAVWALPRLIMQRVMNGSADMMGAGQVLLPPMTDHHQRRIVMPSPDLLYALCPFDLRERALRIRAEPRLARYWSIALYAANSDNFFVLNDRQAAGAPVDLVLTAATTQHPPVPAGTRQVAAPATRGLVLMRVLVGDYATEREAVEAARRTLRCEAF